MARISLGRITSGYLSADKLNSILETIEVTFDRVVFNDGTAPNAMTADLDLGGRSLLNAAADPDDPLSVPNFGQIVDYLSQQGTGYVVQRHEQQVATEGQTVFNLTTMTYTVGVHNLAVYVNGVRVFTPMDYAETDNNTITFAAGLTLDDEVDFVANEFLGTVELPAHEHTWSQITSGLPAFVTRWPTYTEVTGKPTVFTPEPHEHDAAAVTSGRFVDARRGIYVQQTMPTGLGPSDVGVLWFW